MHWAKLELISATGRLHRQRRLWRCLPRPQYDNRRDRRHQAVEVEQHHEVGIECHDGAWECYIYLLVEIQLGIHFFVAKHPLVC